MAKKVKKVKAEELGKIFSGSGRVKKKAATEKKASVRKVKTKKSSVKTEDMTASDLLLETKAEKLKASGKAPLGIVKKTGAAASEEIEKWLSTEPGFLEGLTADVLGNPTKLYKYQIKYLLDPSFFIHIDKSRQCLPEGSMVYTPSGPVCIENLSPGDRIYSFNQKTNMIEIDEVDEAWESGTRQCRNIIFEGEKAIEAGENHPFYSIHRESFKWIKNKDLTNKDWAFYIKHIDTFYSSRRKVSSRESLRVIETIPTQKKLCFDISVKKNKNFIFEGFVVHNTGFSYIYAGRSLAKSHLHEHHTSIFISINQEEANEKILYARGLFESLPLSVQKKVIVDNKHSIEFEDKSGKPGSRTRIISHAQREPRGKGGNVDVYLDEAAHYTWGESIYVAAVPIITRGSGTLTIGSSPLGKKGIHYDILAKEAFRRIYSYHTVYWWSCIDFVEPGRFREANQKAHLMGTEERVARFGSKKLIGIFISMDLEQFQQEYELLHIDESVAFFPLDIINKCLYEIVVDEIFLLDDEYSEKLTFPIVEKYPSIDFKLYKDIEALRLAVQQGKVSDRRLYAGYDVGRKKNNGEFSIIEELKTDPPLQIVRHLQTFRNKKFKYQKNYLKQCLDTFPMLKMKIDSGGIGEDMAEELSDYSWRVDPIHFSNEWKEEICADFRIRLEEQMIGLPNKKDVKGQIHSIKRKVTESGRFIFDAEKNKDHHGDIFWSIAMASSFGERAKRSIIHIPKGAGDRIVVAPRVVPISLARSFPRTPRPTKKMPMGVDGLKVPEVIKNLHMRKAI